MKYETKLDFLPRDKIYESGLRSISSIGNSNLSTPEELREYALEITRSAERARIPERPSDPTEPRK